MAIAEGIYELRSMLQTSMVVTGSGYTPVAGSNVLLYSWNDGNNRKWRFTQNSAGRWRLQNAANGLYMTLGVNVPVQGANVRQWTSSTNAIQYWNVIETGETASFEGYTCPVVRLGNYYDGVGTTWMLDVDGAMTSNNTNMEVNQSSSATSQKFLLVPTALLSNNYPVPTAVGWRRGGAAGPTYWNQGGNAITNMGVGWLCPSTWMPSSSRGYERRIRSRYMSTTTSTYGSWGAWSQWEAATPSLYQQYCYDSNFVDASFSYPTYKAREFQIEVRCVSGETHGQTAAQTVRTIYDPTATLTSDGVSEDGFTVDVTSDYEPATFTIVSITLAGKELLNEPVSVQMLGTTGSITIPWANLDDLPDEGAVASAVYTRGTDLYATDYAGTKTTSLTFTYGTPPATAPTFSDGDGRTLDITHPNGVAGVWVSSGDGVYGGKGLKSVLYPFGRPYKVLVALGDGTLYMQEMPANPATPLHAFNWDGGSFLLECSTDPLVTDRSITADYEAVSLNNRPWQSVHFTDTLVSEFAVSGLLYEGLTESIVRDLMEMLRQHHVTYRAPSGEIADVAVVGASYQTHREYTLVEVNVIQESR